MTKVVVTSKLISVHITPPWHRLQTLSGRHLPHRHCHHRHRPWGEGHRASRPGWSSARPRRHCCCRRRPPPASPGLGTKQSVVNSLNDKKHTHKQTQCTATVELQNECIGYLCKCWQMFCRFGLLPDPPRIPGTLCNITNNITDNVQCSFLARLHLIAINVHDTDKIRRYNEYAKK